MKHLIEKIKLESSNLPRRTIVDKVDIFQMNLALSLQILRVHLQAKLQMLQQLSNPT